MAIKTIKPIKAAKTMPIMKVKTPKVKMPTVKQAKTMPLDKLGKQLGGY